VGLGNFAEIPLQHWRALPGQRLEVFLSEPMTEEEARSGTGLRREIGQLGVGAIALNGTIGAGIFALPAIAVGRAGLFSPWVFVLCGLLIMAIVFVFARISRELPVTLATPEAR
jgi:amino acid permease